MKSYGKSSKKKKKDCESLKIFAPHFPEILNNDQKYIQPNSLQHKCKIYENQTPLLKKKA